VKRPRGVALTPAQRRSPAPPPEPVAVTRRPRAGKVVSLANSFPAPRDQFQRGTCVAFASVAYLEYHLSGASTDTQHQAEQFVYWACKENDGIAAKEGTYVRVARKVLQTQGACLSKTWSYNPHPVGSNEGQGPPPDGAVAEAKNYTWPAARRVAAKDVGRLRECLDEKQPVVLSVRTFPSWDYPAVEDTGEIPMPLPGNHPDGGHAVCLVGYELREGVPGGGVFLFRNSWGGKWARRAGRFGEGYGTLYFAYVRSHGLEAFR
jgi:C1A family cysteine protease